VQAAAQLSDVLLRLVTLVMRQQRKTVTRMIYNNVEQGHRESVMYV